MLREEYMAVSLEEQPAAHRQYYAQFVTPMIKQLVLTHFDSATLVKSYKRDAFFNTSLTPMKEWDLLGSCVGYKKDIVQKLKECGDYLTQAGWVCILKEAARQIVEEEITKRSEG